MYVQCIGKLIYWQRTLACSLCLSKFLFLLTLREVREGGPSIHYSGEVNKHNYYGYVPLSFWQSYYRQYIRGNYKQIYVFTCNILIFLAIMFYALARGSILVCAIESTMFLWIIMWNKCNYYT